MSNNRMEWNGLTELRAALRSLPADLTHDGAEFVEDATDLTESSLIQSYPLGDTGNLRGGVKKTITRTEFGVLGVVKSTSPHAHLWEFGTEVRATRQGWNRGRSPSHHRDGLIPIAVRNRKTMNGKLVALVRSQGFEVNGVL